MITQSKIEGALSRSVCGGWDRGFLESILDQISKGRDLSGKQKQAIGKVLARNTREAQAIHENWSVEYEQKYKSAAVTLAHYHTTQPYYRPMAQDILKGNVPERTKFMRMYENKYSKKVLTQQALTPKYQVGNYLVPRASFDSYKHAEFDSDALWAIQNKIIQNFKKRGGFVITVCDEIKSAAKGAKRYKLLPIGETMPIIVEERFLKSAKKS
jgi:flagellar hook-associated protein FlgK